MSSISPGVVNAPSRQSPAEPSRPTVLEIELDTYAMLTELDGVWCGLARIEAIAPRRFEFREDGLPALVIAIAEFGVLVDIVAILPRPPRWLLRVGDAMVLGGDALDRARLFNQKPVLVETPMDWLMQPHKTCCILNPERDAVEVLAGVPRVFCTTFRLGDRIERAHRRPPRCPKITVLADG